MYADKWKKISIHRGCCHPDTIEPVDLGASFGPGYPLQFLGPRGGLRYFRFYPLRFAK
jgi:hypothetical protein